MDLQELFEQLVGRYALSIHQWCYETSDGRITWLGGLPVLLLRTIGRKSGAERTAALVYLQDGKDLVVVASNGGSHRPPAWLLNVEKTPIVGVQIGRERQRMRGRVASPEERARLWPLVNRPNGGRYDVWPGENQARDPARRLVAGVNCAKQEPTMEVNLIQQVPLPSRGFREAPRNRSSPHPTSWRIHASCTRHTATRSLSSRAVPRARSGGEHAMSNHFLRAGLAALS